MSTNSNRSQEKIRFKEITKQFGRVVALEDVSFTVQEGEILALVGDNGAGKSTLMNVLCGIHESTSGKYYYEDDIVQFADPNEARDRGIETVYQDLALMDDLDVATNIFLGKFPMRFSFGPFNVIDWDKAYTQAGELLKEQLNQEIDPKTEVDFLSGGQRQLVAIARSLAFDPDVLVLDEPTSALSVAGTELVYDTIKTLQDQGQTQIIVSHNFEEVISVADRIVVLYQGTVADIVNASTVTRTQLSDMIKTGKTASELEAD
jgi:ABC-type sugar transport system ATPase subunit